MRDRGILILNELTGTPGGIRTPDPLLRRPVPLCRTMRRGVPLHQSADGFGSRSVLEIVAPYQGDIYRAVYTDRSRQATTYRMSRVLLAGDAAHVHSTFGGQGMNTGLGDAMNLGWKLAATINGWAPADLLDTYTLERHPIGEWVLNWTRAQVAVIRPDPHARAIASVIRDLIATKDGTNYFVEKISGTSMHYDLGGGHPLTGRSAPDFELEDGSRLGDLLHNGHGLLLNFNANGCLKEVCNDRKNRLQCVASRATDEKGLAALLVRPDGFVAWATDSSAPDMATAGEAARRWFGAGDGNA